MHKLFKWSPLFLVVALFGCGGQGGGGGGTTGGPQITSFTANPANVAAAGTPVTLSWQIAGSVTGLEIDNGVGSVNGTSTIVYPTATTAYTLTATNSSGSSTQSATVTLGGGTAPGVEDGALPAGDFGVSLTQDNFQSDGAGNITSATDPRVVTVAPNSTFYALVSYQDVGGVAGVRIRLANSSPAGLATDLILGQSVGGFTLNGEVSGCILDGTQTAVTCIYEIAVGDIGNITSLPGAGSEFAYVLRTNVRDVAGNESDSPPRGYVVVGGSAGTPAPAPTPNPNPGTNRAPSADFSFQQQAGTLAVSFSGQGSSDPDGDSLKYSWSFGDGSSASSRDFRKIYGSAGNKTVSLTVTDPDGFKDTETKPVNVVAPSDGGGGGGGTQNQPPTVSIDGGNPQTATVSTPVNLTATAADPNGDSLTYKWDVTAGTATSVVFGTATAKNTSVQGNNPGQFTLRLTVSDGKGGTASDTVGFNVSAGGITPPTFTLTVEKSGNGTGTVKGTGIDCGGDCSESYPPSTSVILTASAAPGSTFAGWSGAGCSGTGSCTVTMDTTKEVIATFNLDNNPPPLRVLSATYSSEYQAEEGTPIICNNLSTTVAYRFLYEGPLESWTSYFQGQTSGEIKGQRTFTLNSDDVTKIGANGYEVTYTLNPGIAPKAKSNLENKVSLLQVPEIVGAAKLYLSLTGAGQEDNYVSPNIPIVNNCVQL